MYVSFQSAPDQLIGRYYIPAEHHQLLIEFQSAPDQLIGRYRAFIPCVASSAGFNPRPTN